MANAEIKNITDAGYNIPGNIYNSGRYNITGNNSNNSNQFGGYNIPR